MTNLNTAGRTTKMPDRTIIIDRAEHWQTQITKMVASGDYDFAKDFLNGVLEDIEDYENITDGQIQAVKNIRYGRRE